MSFVDQTPNNGAFSHSTRATTRHEGLFDDLPKAAEILKQHYYHDWEFSLTLPKPPLSGYLYTTDVVREVFNRRVGPISGKELQTMESGMVENISLEHLLMYPEDSKEIREHVQTSYAEYSAKRQAMLERGEAKQPTEEAKERNKRLSDEDYELLKVQFQESMQELLSQLPSLKLLKRPIYTELGQESLEARNQARLSRLSGVAPPGLSATPLSPTNLSTLGTPGRPSALPGRPSTAGVALSPEQWTAQIGVGFKRAKAMDVHYQVFCKAVREEKLGLSAESDATFGVTFEILSLLAQCPNQDRRRIWAAVCKITSSPLTEVPQLQNALLEMVPKEMKQNFRDWVKLFTDAAATESFTLRQQRLKVELDMDLSTPQREFTIPLSTKIETFHHPTKGNVVPLTVRPLLPSGSKELATKPTAVCGEDGRELCHHVFMNTRTNEKHGLTQEERQGHFNPHIAVDNGFLLRPVTIDDTRYHVDSDAALYECQAEQFSIGSTLQGLRSSYVFHLYPSHVEYSRIHRRAIHEHTTIHPADRYRSQQNNVVVWLDDDEGAVVEPATAALSTVASESRKRPRED
jgi:hypothetical protein